MGHHDRVAVPQRWERIADLPDGWRELCRDDLAAIHQEWSAQRELLKDPSKLEQFQQRLMTHWAIETGIIERLYTVDRGLTVSLAETGLGALDEFHAKGRISTEARELITDHREALEMVMDIVGGKRDLTSSYIRELHGGLTEHQSTREAIDLQGRRFDTPLLKGEWKRLPNNPTRPDGSVHEYCPPEFVQDEIDQLLSWHVQHEQMGVCPEVEAAWLHHRFTQIHPFEDGNGRVARALTAAVFLKRRYLVLVIRDREHRESYLDALEAADRGNLRPLVDLFADVQAADLGEAMQFVRSLRGEPLVSLAESVAIRAKQRQAASQARAEALLGVLFGIAETRLSEVADEVEHQFGLQGVKVRARALPDDPDKRDWWRTQIVATAQHFGYYADFRQPRWINLRLRLPELERTQTRFVLSLHAIGRAADLHAATAFLATSLSGRDDEESRAELDLHGEFNVACDRPFRFRTETTDEKGTKERFRAWLDETIQHGLSIWAERF